MTQRTSNFAFANPLASPEQLASSGSQVDDVPADLETSIRYAGARLIQAAGVLLRLPQDIIARAIITFTRFYVGEGGGSFRQHAAKARRAFDISAASLYLTAKLSAAPKTPRSILNVYAYLLSSSSPLSSTSELSAAGNDPHSHYLSEGRYLAQRATLFRSESLLLCTLGFITHAALPYTLTINYLQALSASSSPSFSALTKRAFAHLNTALLSPQLLFLTHQPSALATAAIYLAAREVGVKLSGGPWWEVFDTEREELGFLVVAFGSMEGWAREEERKWEGRLVPLTVEEVEAELERSGAVNGGAGG